MAETPFSPDPQESGASPLNAEGPGPDVAGTSSDTPAPEPAPPAPEPAPAPPAAEAPPAAPAPVSEPAPAPAPAEPGIAATLDVPAQESSSGETGEGGGEFELLLQKIRDWFGSGEIQAQWQRLRGPLRGLAILVGVVLLLRVYASLVGTLDSLPLVGGLLELVGLITVTRFSLTRMVRRSDREQVFAEWRRRWNDFRGSE